MQQQVELRESVLRAREDAAEAREMAADSRELELVDREEGARLRAEADRARAEADAARARQEQLLARMLDANERLVVATIKADELAETAAYNEKRFRSLVTTSAALVWQADAAGRINIDPQSWETLTGVPLQSGGDPMWGWLESVHPADRSRARAAWEHALATATSYECELRLRASDHPLWVVSRAVPIAKSGVVREWIGTMTDISARVRVEEAREQFIAILGHDLRNPLSAVMVGAEILAEGQPVDVPALARRILRSCARMEVLIRDVTDFARGRLGGGIPVVLDSRDLGRVCTEVVAEMKQANPSRDLACDLEGDLIVDCDVDRVEQVLSNLIGNAITHGVDPIRVRMRCDRDDVVVVVHNHGSPIPEGQIATLFEPFVRGKAKESRERKGMGLGLYIVREIVRAHRGAIDVTSATDEGTTFTIRWPRRQILTSA